MAEGTTIVPGNRVRAHFESRPERRADRINVGEVERWASLLGGGALTLYGLSRGSLGGLALAALGGGLVYRGATGHCPGYGSLGVSTAGERGRATVIPARRGVAVERAITIDRSPEDLFRFWRNLENLPRVMRHLEAVRTTSPTRSHWVAKGPLGTKVEWDAEIYTERPNELISWRSLPDSEVDTTGSVHFLRGPGGRGTAVKVVLKYDPPAGRLGAAAAKLFGRSPDDEIADDLRRLKEVLEAGECPTTEGQPHGRCGA